MAESDLIDHLHTCEGMEMREVLKGKVAVVTGAAQGIGEFISREFCRQGASVFMGDIDEERLTRTAESLSKNGQHVAKYVFDTTNRGQVQKAIAAAVDRFKGIDILVNNVGVYPRKHFLDMTHEDWDRIIDVNLNGTFNCTRAVVPLLVGRRSGSIIQVSSVTFFTGMAKLSHYVAAKGGIIGFTRSLARDLGEHGIRVNCISPGAVATESESNFGTAEEMAATILPLQSLKRRIIPEDIANVAVFLASDLSSAMTGQTLNVDGGWVMH
jgi:3-oxoacyl-[acyl-carrier protein] reductase